MKKVKVKDSNSLYRDEESGAILNCNDAAYNNYLKMKENKMKEVQDRAHRYCFIANSLSDEVKVKIN